MATLFKKQIRNRPKCPNCQKPAASNGKTRSGSRKWRCRTCNLTWTEGGKDPHRPRVLGYRTLTASERAKRYLQKKQNNANKTNKRRSRKRTAAANSGDQGMERNP